MKLIITNFPAYYKISLFNRINEKIEIFVIYTSRDIYSDGRNSDFISGQMNFKHVFLENTSTLNRLKQLKKIYKSNQWDEVIVSGWDSRESIFAFFLSAKEKTSLICESAVYESKLTGIKGFIKRCLLKHVSKVYVPGIANGEIFKRLNFQGKIVYTGSCGILNYVPQPAYNSKKTVKNFLYVGRLIPVKNLELLITVFNELPDLQLNIIGEGILKSELQSISKENIHFLGYINNKDLSKYYQENDVFMLPSLSEPWGLVVEEALNNGLPVIVSNRVGCNKDLATKETGLIFEYNNPDSLKKAISQITNIDFYNSLRLNISKMDFNQRAENQVEKYLEKL